MAQNHRFRVPAEPMTRAELLRFKQAVALMNVEDVERHLRVAIDNLTVRPLPPPRLMQELVAFWESLWKRRNQPRRHIYN